MPADSFTVCTASAAVAKFLVASSGATAKVAAFVNMVTASAALRFPPLAAAVTRLGRVDVELRVSRASVVSV